ncbi:hypothetical protein [Micromonospora haikouensis]|uniref:hypothetical protein n=1 Tax=Micromonospora haikouensis TaxID=686309 RepID=UPI003D759DC2
MKVTIKPGATTTERALVAKAERIACRVKSLPAGSPTLAGLNRQYQLVVDALGRDPIS